MQMSFHHSYPGSREEVVALFRNPEFLADMAHHAQATHHEISVTDTHTQLDLTLSPPPQIATFTGSAIHMSQIFRWLQPDETGSRRGTVDVTVAGLPVKVNAQAILRPINASTSEADYHGDLTVKVPLVGRKIEKQIAPMISEAFEGIEHRIRHWLSQTN